MIQLMFDDFNRMDDSETRDDMMDRFEKLLQDKTLPLSLIGFCFANTQDDLRRKCPGKLHKLGY